MLRFSLPVVFAALLLSFPAASSAAAPMPLPGTVSDWHGFRRHVFEVDGREVQVVAPPRAAPGRPWVWHGEFFGHKPAPDIELLKRGFHVVYMSVPDMLGSPTAVEHWNAFYAELTGKHGLADKAALVGLSRGGLYCYNWAIANPDKVACIYGDAPVCDFKSWPGGKGKGKGSARDWKLVLSEYHFANEAEALAYENNPIDRLQPLADAGVPLLHVYGEADDVVPWEENTGVIAQRYRALGGDITLISKPGVGHHPHGLEDSTPIVEFIVKHSAVEGEATNVAAAPSPRQLRVLSYNIHHGEGIDGKLDLKRIANVILSVKPDLVALQEIDHKTDRTGGVEQATVLAELTSMHGVFGDNIEFGGGQYGNAVLSRFPIARHANHRLPNVDQGEQRGVLEVEIELEEGKLTLWATHLDYRGDDAERLASAKAINALAAKGNARALLAGDLNDVPDSRTLQELGKEWTRANRQIEPTIPVKQPTKQIDYVLYRPADEWKVIETKVLDEAVASDHRAVLAVLEWVGDDSE